VSGVSLRFRSMFLSNLTFLISILME